jgi:aminomethyltransferase
VSDIQYGDKETKGKRQYRRSMELLPPCVEKFNGEKPAFVGREALVAQRQAGPTRRLRGLLALDRGIPRPHMAVRRISSGEDPLAGEVIGEVTSGTFSPTLKLGIGLALLDTAVSVDDEVVVDVRGRASRFRVVKPPFVEPSTR